MFCATGIGIVALEPSPNVISAEHPLAHHPGFALVMMPVKVTASGAVPDCGEAETDSAGSACVGVVGTTGTTGALVPNTVTVAFVRWLPAESDI